VHNSVSTRIARSLQAAFELSLPPVVALEPPTCLFFSSRDSDSDPSH